MWPILQKQQSLDHPHDHCLLRATKKKLYITLYWLMNRDPIMANHNPWNKGIQKVYAPKYPNNLLALLHLAFQKNHGVFEAQAFRLCPHHQPKATLLTA